MHNWSQQVSWSRRDTWSLKMPPVCAVTGAPADSAIIVSFGGIDLILPATSRVRADHDRPFGDLRTAWRLRPSIRDGVVTVRHLPRGFVEQLVKLNEPGRIYVGGLYPLKDPLRDRLQDRLLDSPKTALQPARSTPVVVDKAA